jgi:hypothetical protein
MALNGIDAQIMTQRTADTVKNASTLNKRNELMQDYMALQRKTEDEIQDRVVLELERKDDPRITKEHKGAGQDAGGGQHGKRQKARPSEESEEEEEPGFISSSSRIDIRI